MLVLSSAICFFATCYLSGKSHAFDMPDRKSCPLNFLPALITPKEKNVKPSNEPRKKAYSSNIIRR